MWVISDKIKQRAAGWYLVHIFICPHLMISLNGYALTFTKKKREILKYDILCLSGEMHSCAVQYWPSMTINKRFFFFFVKYYRISPHQLRTAGIFQMGFCSCHFISKEYKTWPTKHTTLQLFQPRVLWNKSARTLNLLLDNALLLVHYSWMLCWTPRTPFFINAMLKSKNPSRGVLGIYI